MKMMSATWTITKSSVPWSGESHYSKPGCLSQIFMWICFVQCAKKVTTVFFQSRNSNIFNTRLGLLYFCLRYNRPFKSLHVRLQISSTRYHPNITNITHQILNNWIFEYFRTSDMLPGIVKATNATALKQETEGGLWKNITNISQKCHEIFSNHIINIFPKIMQNYF